MDHNTIIFLGVGVLGILTLAAIFMLWSKRGGGGVTLDLPKGKLSTTSKPDPAKADLSRLQAEEDNKVKVINGAELQMPDAKLGKRNDVEIG